MTRQIQHSQNEIFRAANALFKPGDVIELRILGSRNGREVTTAGYFDDFVKLAQIAVRCSGRHGVEGLYWTLNPCNPALLARCVNHVNSLKNTTSDKDIRKRAHLLIDCDPVRPTGISSTNEEKALAKVTAEGVRNHLCDAGWPESFFADSGNGYHLIYAVDLLNDDSARDLLRACLEALAVKFDSDAVKIDTAVFNASRICKVYGTLAAKGDSTPDRPHRVAHLLRVPEQASRTVSRELLEALASEAPKQAAKPPNSSAGRTAPEKIEELLALAGIEHRGRLQYGDGRKWQLQRCWFDASHTATSVIVTLGGNGALGYHCAHASCSGNDWRKFREEVEEKLGRKFYIVDGANSKAPAQGSNPWLLAEGMDVFLAGEGESVAFLFAPLIVKESVTEMFSPRGIGKTMWALFVAVQLVKKGCKVLLIDRDNPRREVKSRLRSFGATRDLAGLKIISREKAPSLTNTRAWEEFPYFEYDLVIVDSLDSAAEGVGEQDSAKPSKAIAPLLDIAHRENGPAVLVLGNCVKTGAHSRGSGVIEDRADIVCETRDCTNFHPSGKKPWVEELPAADAGSWASRSSRRKKQIKFRLAFIPTKFRVGEEPEPFMVELNLADEPWTVEDVTDLVDLEGKAERERCARDVADRIGHAKNGLLDEINRRVRDSEPPLYKDRDAIPFLQKSGLRRNESRQLLRDGDGSEWRLIALEGAHGNPIAVLPPGYDFDACVACYKEISGGKTTLQKPAKNAGFHDSSFRHTRPERAAERYESQVFDSSSVIGKALPAAAPKLTAPQGHAVEPKNGAKIDADEVLL